MEQYKATNLNAVIRVSDGLTVHFNPDLPEYRQYLADVAAGAEVLPADPVPTDIIWERIKAHRDNLTENGGYKVVVANVDKWFHSDQKSRSQQLGLVLLGANISPSLQWKTMDGTFVPMTQVLAQQILVAAALSDQAIFAAAEQHRIAMEASANPSSYDFSTGWPATYA